VSSSNHSSATVGFQSAAVASTWDSNTPASLPFGRVMRHAAQVDDACNALTGTKCHGALSASKFCDLLIHLSGTGNLKHTASVTSMVSVDVCCFLRRSEPSSVCVKALEDVRPALLFSRQLLICASTALAFLGHRQRVRKSLLEAEDDGAVDDDADQRRLTVRPVNQPCSARLNGELLGQPQTLCRWLTRHAPKVHVPEDCDPSLWLNAAQHSGGRPSPNFGAVKPCR